MSLIAAIAKEVARNALVKALREEADGIVRKDSALSDPYNKGKVDGLEKAIKLAYEIIDIED